MHVREMGIKLQGSEQLPFLKTGMTAADFQILAIGHQQLRFPDLKFTVKAGAIFLATSFRKRAGRLSGLVALRILIFCKRSYSYTPSIWIRNGELLGKGAPSSSGV